jgi:hypothetical protein
MARITRPVYRRKAALRMSKGEAALEAAFKEVDVESVGDVTTLTLTRIPDVIIVPSLTSNCVIDIVVPEGGPDAFDRVVKVVNQDAAQTVQIKVNGGSGATALVATKTADYYIADSTAQTTPVELFVQA